MRHSFYHYDNKPGKRLAPFPYCQAVPSGNFFEKLVNQAPAAALID
jgi:hypothetical protein